MPNTRETRTGCQRCGAGLKEIAIKVKMGYFGDSDSIYLCLDCIVDLLEEAEAEINCMKGILKSHGILYSDSPDG